MREEAEEVPSAFDGMAISLRNVGRGSGKQADRADKDNPRAAG